MFTKETVGGIIEDCRLMVKLFSERHDGSNVGGKPLIRISTAGVDGGGLSTYGKSAVIGEDDMYECHDGYLYIHREFENYDRDYRRKVRTESVAFIPYESIVAIECSVCASI